MGDLVDLIIKGESFLIGNFEKNGLGFISDRCRFFVLGINNCCSLYGVLPKGYEENGEVNIHEGTIGEEIDRLRRRGVDDEEIESEILKLRCNFSKKEDGQGDELLGVYQRGIGGRVYKGVYEGLKKYKIESDV
jgi:hypothetical protein